MPQRNYNLLRKENVMREIDSLAIPGFQTPALAPFDQLRMFLFHPMLHCLDFSVLSSTSRFPVPTEIV